MRQNMRQNVRADQRRDNLKTNYYIDGNTVRRLEGEPQERRKRQMEKEQERIRKKNRRIAKRNQEKALHISLGYVMFCAMAVCLLAGVCVTYIRLQSDITSRTKNISMLESEITNLRADNDAAEKRITLSTDLDAVKQKALELGMKFASPDQIIYYSVEDNDFMDQYSDIPE